MNELWEMMTALLALFGALCFGVSIGVGIALGFEIVMRLSGDGRAVLLTWARVKHKDANE